MTEKMRGIETRLQHPRVEAAPAANPSLPPSTKARPTFCRRPNWGPRSQRAGIRNVSTPGMARPMSRLSRPLSLISKGAESAVAVGSGVAAIAAAILSNVRAGDHVVAQTAHYTAALSLLTEWLPRQGVEVTQVDQTDIAAFPKRLVRRHASSTRKLRPTRPCR